MARNSNVKPGWPNTTRDATYQNEELNKNLFLEIRTEPYQNHVPPSREKIVRLPGTYENSRVKSIEKPGDDNVKGINNEDFNKIPGDEDLRLVVDKSKAVWGDVDDDAYIAELITRRAEVHSVVKRDSSDSVVDSEDMWDFESDCDCMGPPPEFFLPPPPRPPFLQTDYYCGDDPLSDLETCDSEPKIDAYNHNSPSLQTSAAIALCSIVLLLGIFVGGLLLWKHKRKSTNLFPSKSSSISSATATTPQCRLPPPPAPLYEDLDMPRRSTLNHQRVQQCEPQLEMVERKRPTGGCPGTGRVFVCGSGSTWRGGTCGGDTCGAPLYEELPRRPSEESLPGSEEHFAEDELSLVGDKAHPCRQCVQHSLPYRGRPPRYDRRPRSLERRRAAALRHHHPEVSEFHEGVLLDALLRLYPNVGTVGTRGRPAQNIACSGGAWPGDIPLGHPRAPRVSPKPPSQDSSFGSDSGYSNNTCGTCGTRGSGRNRYSTTEMGMS